jgi:predicted kinase
MFSRAKIIIVAGYCATGKSTFARNLAPVLGIPCFAKDTVKEAMADGFGANSGLLQSKGSAAAANLMLHIAECFFKAGTACILEANFQLSQGEKIKVLAEKYQAECLTFLFRGDLDILWKRYVKRESERHWVHISVDEDRDYFVNGHLDAGIGEVEIGETIYVDANDFEKIEYDQLIEIARQFAKRPFAEGPS